MSAYYPDGLVKRIAGSFKEMDLKRMSNYAIADLETGDQGRKRSMLE